jgi:hypothetical protein
MIIKLFNGGGMLSFQGFFADANALAGLAPINYHSQMEKRPRPSEDAGRGRKLRPVALDKARTLTWGRPARTDYAALSGCEQEVRTVRNDLAILLNTRKFQICPRVEDGNLRRKVGLRFNGSI